MTRPAQFLRRFLPLLLALVLWGLFFRPLPLHLSYGIPFTAHHRETPVVHSLVPGDHLQLLYHFWLTRDMLAGGTPPFHNLYEFNTGDDSARRVIDPGYIPFSLVYALISPWAGHALGWNVAQLLAVILSVWLLFLLARRYSGSPPAALAAAALAMCLPYPWITLATGSPTGYGMALVPAIALGLDIAVRDGRRRGGVLAGAALIFCYTSDLHSFFFGALLVPAWCLVAWCAKDRCAQGLLPTRRELAGLVRSLWPTAVFGAVAVGIAAYVKSQYAGTDVEGGRTLLEVTANSPERLAMLGRVVRGADLHFRIGAVLLVAMLLVVALAGAVAVRRWRKVQQGTEEERSPVAGGVPMPMLVLGVLALGILGVVLLGLGTNAPPGGLPIRVMRKLLPPYRMIRQPVKILCVLPTVMAPFFGLGLSVVWRALVAGRRRFSKGAAAAAVSALVVWAVADVAGALRVGIARLPEPNGAYGAVAADAAVRGRDPHVLIVPIWPGDSAWSSVYEYHAMQGRIRMVNGYAPVLTDEYLDSVFRACESVTQGRLTDTQADALRAMGVTAVVLHEDAFPDVVSPFPAGATLERLMASPWLEFLQRDEGVWAFALRDTARFAVVDHQTSDGHYPARWWRWTDEAAVRTATLRSPVAQWLGLRWLVRVQGDGALRVRRRFLEDGEDVAEAVTVDDVTFEGGLFFAKQVSGPPQPTATLDGRVSAAGAQSVRWLELPFGELPREGWATPSLEVEPTEGSLQITDVLLAGATSLMEREVVRLAAVDLFRRGVRTTMEDGTPGILFRPEHDPEGEVLYGPHLPLSPGTWRVSMDCETGSDAAGEVGRLRVLLGGKEVSSGLVGPGHAAIEFTTRVLEPLVLRFAYAGKTEVRVGSLVLERVPDTAN